MWKKPVTFGLILMVTLIFGRASGQTRLDQVLRQSQDRIPFSFDLAGKHSSDFLASWKRRVETGVLNEDPKCTTIIYSDPHSALEVRERLTVFAEGGVENILFFRNRASKTSPLIENILPLDLTIPNPGAAVTFHHALGSAIRQDGQSNSESLSNDYRAIDNALEIPADIFIAHYVMQGVTQVESHLPFFNLAWAEGGVMGAIGWTGQWMIHVTRNQNGDISLRSGQQTTHFVLQPGEEVRTPSTLLVAWSGTDWTLAQNRLRRILVAHYLPQIGGSIAIPPVAHSSAYVLIFDSIAQTTGQNPLDVLPKLKANDLDGRHGFSDPDSALNYVTNKNQLSLVNNLPSVGLEAYWLDAGWFEGGWPNGRGSWEPNKKFLGGLGPLGDAAHTRGLKFLLWFDPEGVAPGSIIDRQHKDWVFRLSKKTSTFDGSRSGGIFRYENSEARHWMIEMLSNRIRDWHIDILRMDRNTCPLPFWEEADAEDRKGMTEIRQIEGLYTTLDALRERFPTLEIDNANWRVTGPDIEMMKRTIGSLTRSELTSGGIPHPTQDQFQTQELAFWIPLSANLLHGMDPYNVRSTATLGVGIGLDLSSPFINLSELRKAIDEIKELRPFWLGDYYPLTDIGLDETKWSGWQFDRSDLHAGFVLLFRRPRCSESTFTVTLHGIDPTSRYIVSLSEGFEKGPETVVFGKQLLSLPVSSSSIPGSVLLRYRKVMP
jgi:alpha-galactosidase